MHYDKYKKRVHDVQWFNINTASDGGACSCDRTVFRLNTLSDRQVLVVSSPGGVSYGFKMHRDDNSPLENEGVGA